MASMFGDEGYLVFSGLGENRASLKVLFFYRTRSVGDCKCGDDTAGHFRMDQPYVQSYPFRYRGLDRRDSSGGYHGTGRSGAEVGLPSCFPLKVGF